MHERNFNNSAPYQQLEYYPILRVLFARVIPMIEMTMDVTPDIHNSVSRFVEPSPRNNNMHRVKPDSPQLWTLSSVL